MDDAVGKNQGQKQSAEPFHALLTPHRSLSPNGFLLVMGALGLVSFITGVVFASLGAWPVLGFFGLDVLIVYLAFKLNYRSGRLYETVELTSEALILKRVHPSGRQEQFEFNPYWVQIRLANGPDGRLRLHLGSHGRHVQLGTFLTDDERRSFADALQGALVVARGGPRI